MLFNIMAVVHRVTGYSVFYAAHLMHIYGTLSRLNEDLLHEYSYN